MDSGAAFTGGASNDTFNATGLTLNALDSLNGGAGSNTLNIVDTAGNQNTTGIAATLKNIQTVNVSTTGSVGSVYSAAHSAQKEIQTVTISGVDTVNGETWLVRWNGLQVTTASVSTDAAAATAVAAAFNALAGATVATAIGSSVVLSSTVAGEPLPNNYDLYATGAGTGQTTWDNHWQQAQQASAGSVDAVYDVSGMADVTTLNVTASQGSDNIKVAATQTANITNTTGGVTLDGGKSQTVIAKGDINLTGSVGQVSATNNDKDNSSSTTITGGTNVTVDQKGYGNVAVGDYQTPSTNPTGTVTVTSAKDGNIEVHGGTDVTITNKSGWINVGNQAWHNSNNFASANNPTGNVVINQGSSNGSEAYGIDLTGGKNITIVTAGALTNWYNDVNVGAYLSSTAGGTPTGAISITSKTSTLTGTGGAYNVKGGTTVTIDTPATSGSITIGSAPAVNAAGTALNAETLASTPTGNVVVKNGSANTYGSSTTTVYTNGATSVQVTGGGNGSSITDANTTLATSGTNAGAAIAASNLASVSLTGVSGAWSLTSDALTDLTIAASKDSTLGRTAVTAVTVHGSTGQTATHAQTVTLNSTAANTSLTDDLASGFTVNTAGATTDKDNIALSGAKATSVTFNNAAELTLNSLTLKTVTVTSKDTIVAKGTGALKLGTVLNAAIDGATGYVSSVDASAASGAVTATLDATKTSFTGGSGNDVITVATNVPTKVIDGGAGTNTLVVNYVAGTGDVAIASNANFKNFTTLTLGAAADSNTNTAAYDSTGFTTVNVGAVAAAVTVSNLAAGAALNVTASPGYAVTYKSADASGTADSLNLSVGTNGATTGTASSTVTVVDGGDATASTNKIENVIITSNGKLSTSTNTVTLTDSAVKTITIKGTSAFTAGGTTGGTAVTSIDASAATGAVTLTNWAQNYKSTGVTVTGGAGKLTATGGAAGTTVITSGAGGATLTVGTAGATSSASGVLQFAGGTQSFNLAASAAKADTVVQADKGYVSIASFADTAAATADKITFANAVTVLANTTGSTATGITGLNYQSINGVVAFEGAGPVLLSSFSDADLLQAAYNILNASSAADKAAVFASQNGTDTYVVASGHTTGAGLTVSKLAGVTSVAGLGTTAAGNTVLVTNVTNTTVAQTETTASTAAARVYDAAGKASVVSDASLTVGSGAVIGTTSTSFKNLAAAAEIDLTTTGFSSTKLVTTQVGAAGANSLTVKATANNTISELNVTGDWSLNLSATANKTLEIAKLVDGATTDTLTNITVSGPGTTNIKAIADSALTSIDASAATGAVNIGYYNSGVSYPVSNAGLTVKTSQAVSDVYASGDNTAVSLTSTSGAIGGGYVELSGASSTVSASAAGTLGYYLDIATNGTGAVIDLSKVGTDNVHGYGTRVYGVNGVGDNSTIKLGAGAGSSAIQQVDAGVNTHVYIGGDYDTVTVGKAVWGATGNMTTIQLGKDASGEAVPAFAVHDLISFDGGNAYSFIYGTRNVNVSEASTLADALKIADDRDWSGYASWFQFGGDTYLIQSNSNASDTAVDAQDVVVKIVGLHDLSTTDGSGHVVIGA